VREQVTLRLVQRFSCDVASAYPA